jgi:ATP-dependent exoDNAse (exonuclease V) beta subunit
MQSDLGAGTSAEIEEERRLLYVVMTRAKDDLHLVVPQRFCAHGHSKGDRYVYASRTRFIPETCSPTPVCGTSDQQAIGKSKQSFAKDLRRRSAAWNWRRRIAAKPIRGSHQFSTCSSDPMTHSV